MRYLMYKTCTTIGHRISISRYNERV